MPVAGCGPCRWAAVQLTPSAMPTRTVTKVEDYNFQKEFAREFTNGDREAYRRLRQNGLQPPKIAGSAHLERHAETRFEVESGQIVTDRTGLRDAMDMCKESGIDPLKATAAVKGN